MFPALSRTVTATGAGFLSVDTAAMEAFAMQSAAVRVRVVEDRSIVNSSSSRNNVGGVVDRVV